MCWVQMERQAKSNGEACLATGGRHSIVLSSMERQAGSEWRGRLSNWSDREAGVAWC